MIKPKKLQKGDMVAIVSLSSGMAGEETFKHKYELGKKRLEDLGLKVIEMPNTLKGNDYLNNHPELRARDLMEAFEDNNIKAIFSSIGGDDTIRLLPYINFDIIKNNPKIFMGYSDTTVNHFMMYKAGLVSFYGPSVLCEFGENGQMHNYTLKYINDILFENKKDIEIISSPLWTNERLDWTDKSLDTVARKMKVEEHGFEVLQGSETKEGILLGGCLDVFPMVLATTIWPKADEWENKILYLETSEEKPLPEQVKYLLRNLVAQGIIDKINGIIVGKPKDETYYEEYKQIYKEVIGKEAGKSELPIIYNVNFGHSAPMCIIPNGIKVRLDLTNKKIILLEKALDD